MAESASGQDKNESCVLIGYTSGQNGPIFPAWDHTHVGPAKKKFSFWPFNKSFIEEDCSVTVAGYLLRSFFHFY